MNAPTELIDYTPVAICLAKVFEREINLSIVHWIRQDLGVDLPGYFNKHQDQVDAIFSHPGIRDIDFNKSGTNNRWNPPAIGESQLAYRQVAQQMQNWFNPPDNFLENWDTIRKVRNQAAHTEYVGQESVRTIQHTLNQLVQGDIFTTLFKMKTMGRKSGFQLNP